MLDSPPGEPEWKSWFYVLAGALLIYCTIPFARAFRELVADQIGLDFFLYLTAILTLLAAVMAFINLRSRKLPSNAYLWLFGIVAAFMLYIYRLREIPEEAIHVAEYGAIGLLVYRALLHRIRDVSIYVIAALIVGMIGVLDEYIQWVTPSRVFDLRDIRTNFLAGVLGQLAIFAGLRPCLVAGFPSSASWSRLCYTLVFVLALLAVGFLNTPQRIAWYGSRVPSLAFLLDSKSMMIEYGYHYQDSEIGGFKSRFSPQELQQLNWQRGKEVAAILDQYIRGGSYKMFVGTFTVPRDAYAHEVGVHLFRRDRYFARAQKQSGDPGKLYDIASRENLILSKYYAEALNNSRHRWSEQIEKTVAKKSARISKYESPVSAGLITRFKQWQVLSFFAAIITVFAFLRFSIRRAGSEERGQVFDL